MSPAPPLLVERWFNTPSPIELAALRGKVVVLRTFQMLCPGCVLHALPQAKKLHELAGQLDGRLVVLGLHTVFEHHAAMTPTSLEAFLHEFRITFPVGVDLPSDEGPIPRTMAAYGLEGTPSTVIIDREGRIVRRSLGTEDELTFGMMLGGLLSRPT